MRTLELLAPARNIEIGIAAIDCGADAVYIAGPAFGARQAAGNSIEDISGLCDYAHKFGARIFLTLNTILYDEELREAEDLMQKAEQAGVDAIIVQDLAIMKMADGGTDGKTLGIPLHASTQCAIRDVDKAMFYRQAGFSRLVLERELSLETVRKISESTGCEIEFFVHGALCVCYSGQCYMSEYISGRSANRGECIQACRSLYDLTDDDGKVLVRNKALLSLKDYNLLHRLEDLADAGVDSFKIEGRLKNISYVKNTVRAYSQALDEIIRKHPDKYCRASFGKVSGGFTPDLNKTFNRGYTELFLDGKRGHWASMDTPKGMGEAIGKVVSVKPLKNNEILIGLNFRRSSGGGCSEVPVLNNGDGFAFTDRNGEIIGFRGDVCSGSTIRCKNVPNIRPGINLFRNISSAFEKELSARQCKRTIGATVSINISETPDSHYLVLASAITEDGRRVDVSFDAGTGSAQNEERARSMFESQIDKEAGIYSFRLSSVHTETGSMPFCSSAFLNEIRRTIAEKLDQTPLTPRPMLDLRTSDHNRRSGSASDKTEGHFPANQDIDYKFNVSNHLSRSAYGHAGGKTIEEAYELSHRKDAELMRTRYCIKYELGICPKYCGTKGLVGPLHLHNNGRSFRLSFDCSRCEMTVSAEETKK